MNARVRFLMNAARVALATLVSARAWGQAPPQLPPPPPPPGSSPQPPREPPPARDQPREPPKREPQFGPRVHPSPTPPPPEREHEHDRDHDEAAAPPPGRTGIELAGGLAYSIPMGNVSDANGKMGDTFGAEVPFFLELAYRFTPNIAGGLFTSLAFGGPSGAFKTSCAVTNASCVATAFRIGVDVTYRFKPNDVWTPWAGGGLGLEWNSVSRSVAGLDTGVGYSGVELVHLLGGVDFRLSRTFTLGPYADWSFGQYTHRHDSVTQTDADITHGSIHAWFTIGARFTFLP